MNIIFHILSQECAKGVYHMPGYIWGNVWTYKITLDTKLKVDDVHHVVPGEDAKCTAKNQLTLSGKHVYTLG
jgi:hypothetical protein